MDNFQNRCAETPLTDMAVVDAHMHQWDPLNTPRAVSPIAKLVERVPSLRPALTRFVPRSTREFLGDLTPHLTPYLPADYTPAARAAGVSSIVHIEAGWRSQTTDVGGHETRWISSLPFGHNDSPELGAIVVAADPALQSVATTLDGHLQSSSLVRGVRRAAGNHPDPGIMDFTPRPGVLAAAEFLDGFAAVAERGLSFEIWVYSHQIPDVLVLALKYPETTFVVEHYAMPAGVLGPSGRCTGTTRADRADILARWKDGIASLAGLPNIVAKHTGLGMAVLGANSSSYEARRDELAPLISYVHEQFGPDRSMWGSNQPIDGPVLELPDSIRMVQEVIADRATDRALFGGTARRVYRI